MAPRNLGPRATVPTHEVVLADIQALSWGAELISNYGNLLAGYNDAVGGQMVETNIVLTHVVFRLADPVATIGGTGNLTVQIYQGTPTVLDVSPAVLVHTITIAAGQHDVVSALVTPTAIPINAVLRAKYTLGTTTVAGPCHVQFRGRLG